MLQETMGDNWVFQEIGQEYLAKGMEQGLEQGMERGLKQGQELEHQRVLQKHREAFLDIVRERFPKLVRLARSLSNDIDDTIVLFKVGAKLYAVENIEEARNLLISLSDESEE